MSNAKAEARHKAAEALHREMYGDTDGLYGNATYAANAAIDAYEAALEKAGLVLVPREISDEIFYAMREVDFTPSRFNDGYGAPDIAEVTKAVHELYAAMIAAAEGK